MFRRPESLRERTLLKLIEMQARTISDQNDRIMHLEGRPWQVPPSDPKPKVDALERTWTATPEQEPLQ